jgi:hypothetical protein
MTAPHASAVKVPGWLPTRAVPVRVVMRAVQRSAEPLPQGAADLCTTKAVQAHNPLFQVTPSLYHARQNIVTSLASCSPGPGVNSCIRSAACTCVPALSGLKSIRPLTISKQVLPMAILMIERLLLENEPVTTSGEPQSISKNLQINLLLITVWMYHLGCNPVTNVRTKPSSSTCDVLYSLL